MSFSLPVCREFFFFLNIRNGCWILSSALSASTEIIMFFLSVDMVSYVD